MWSHYFLESQDNSQFKRIKFNSKKIINNFNLNNKNNNNYEKRQQFTKKRIQQRFK